MIRQDYILRMIEQAAQMLARLVKHRKEGNVDDAQKLEHETAGTFLELTGEHLDKWNDEQIYGHVRRSGPPVEFPFRLGVAIALLESRAELCVQQGDPGGAGRALARAIGVLLRAKIESVNADVPGFAPGLQDLLAKIPPGEMPVATAGLLVCCYEHTGQFAEAEDALFHLQEQVGNDADVRQLGETFYQRLLRRPDAALADGDLPRAEVEQGAVQWAKLFS